MMVCPHCNNEDAQYEPLLHEPRIDGSGTDCAYYCWGCGKEWSNFMPARVCDEEGCTSIVTNAYHYPTEPEDQVTWLCDDHAAQNGFCLGCMHFSAGTDDYDFSTIKGWCGECVEELRYENGEYEHEYDGDDAYDYDFYGAAWVDDSTNLVELEQDIADAAGEPTTPTEIYIGPDNPAFGGM